MILSANTYGAQPEWSWHDSSGSVQTMTLGYLDISFTELMKQASGHYDSFAKRVQASGTTVSLTGEQKRYLAENFDPENMAWAEYRAFIDKLCAFGVLAEEDKNHVGYSNLIPIECTKLGASISPSRTNPMRYTGDFSSSRGNVLDWTAYLAGNTVWDERTYSWQRSPEAILFGKIRGVLESISG